MNEQQEIVIEFKNEQPNNQQYGDKIQVPNVNIDESKEEFIDESQVDELIANLNKLKIKKTHLLDQTKRLIYIPQASLIISALIIITIQISIACGFNLAYGILFLLFISNKDFNDGCENDQLKSWGKAACILNFIIIGMMIIQYFCRICQSSNFPQHKLDKIIKIFNFCQLIAIIVVSFGLAISDDKYCGQLHKLSLSYYIISFILVGIAIIINTVAFLIGIYKKYFHQ